MSARLGRDRFDQARLINIANALTAVRIVLVPAVAYFLIEGRFGLALGLFLLSGLSDALDGALARWLKQRTEFGFFLDPIADKLLLATSFVVLAIVKVVPVWLSVLVISRDIFILLGSVVILLLAGAGAIAVTGLSKVNTLVQVATVLYFLAARGFPGGTERILPGSGSYLDAAVVMACAATTAASGLQYLFIGIRKLSRA